MAQEDIYVAVCRVAETDDQIEFEFNIHPRDDLEAIEFLRYTHMIRNYFDGVLEEGLKGGVDALRKMRPDLTEEAARAEFMKYFDSSVIMS